MAIPKFTKREMGVGRRGRGGMAANREQKKCDLRARISKTHFAVKVYLLADSEGHGGDKVAAETKVLA